MSNTPETNDEAPQEFVPVDKIPPFFLTVEAHQRVHDGKPDDHIPKEAIPYLLMETRFGIPVPKEEEWPEALIKSLGDPKKVCKYLAVTLRLSTSAHGARDGHPALPDDALPVWAVS